LARGTVGRGYWWTQAQKKSVERSQCSRNAAKISPETWLSAKQCLDMQWRPEQIAEYLTISHETACKKVFAVKAHGGHLWFSLRLKLLKTD
jgi:hypothetical protein